MSQLQATRTPVDRDSSTPDGHFQIERVTGTLGAEVSGLDLSKPMPGELVAALLASLAEHKVLFFRDQNITMEEHLAFGRQFGPLEVHPFTRESAMFAESQTHPEIFTLESTAEAPFVAEQWHSDVTWRECPSLGSILRCRITPPYGGDTLWADMAAAFEGLDDATQSRISGMTAVHDWPGFRRSLRRNGVSEDSIAELQVKFPPVEHPVVRTHPVTGKKILYVNGSFTQSIKGMGETESNELLQRLYRQATETDYQVRFRWRANSIAFWDNRSTQHRVAADFFPQHRLMERVTVAGDKPF